MTTASSKHRLAEMSFVEFRERLPEKPVMVIALGSQEEQGPTCPMGDYRLTEIIADRAAMQAGGIVAPIIPFGYADYFRSVPGGIALRAETFSNLLEDVIVNFLDHDLDRIVILNGHSGNAGLIDQTVRRLRRDRQVLIPALHMWRSIPASIWQQIHGADAAKAKGHGADPLTSVYMTLLPELLRPDLADSTPPAGKMLGLPTSGLGAVAFGEAELTLAVNVDDHCSNGIASGDPALSSAAKGEVIVEYLVDLCAKVIEHMKTADPKL
jgi:creatinine amidohydrolase